MDVAVREVAVITISLVVIPLVIGAAVLLAQQFAPRRASTVEWWLSAPLAQVIRRICDLVVRTARLAPPTDRRELVVQETNLARDTLPMGVSTFPRPGKTHSDYLSSPVGGGRRASDKQHDETAEFA